MTAPRWIVEAIEAVTATVRGGEVFQDIPLIDAARLPSALIERLPMEAMTAAIRERIAGVGGITGDWIGAIAGLAAAGATHVLTAGDPEVVELTELYQGACRALDAAGAPYETGGGEELAVRLNLAGRILWLAEQRPTRLELQGVQVERDQAREAHNIARVHNLESADAFAESLADAAMERDGLIARLQSVEAERDQLQRMYEGASDDLDSERTAHQEAEGAAANRELALTVDLESARRQAQELKAAVTERNTAIRALVESELPAGDLRLALAGMIGFDDWKLHLVDLDRHAQQRKIADQAAYIDQLELEIEALEDQIDRLDSNPDLPDMWTGCKVGAP